MFNLRVYLICVSLDFLLYLAKPSATIDHSAPAEKQHLELNIWPWTLTLTAKQVERQQNIMSKYVSSSFDLELWPMTLTYNPNLAKVKVNHHARNQGHRSNGSNRRAGTNKHTDKQTDATKRIVSPASRSIIRGWWVINTQLRKIYSFVLLIPIETQGLTGIDFRCATHCNSFSQILVLSSFLATKKPRWVTMKMRLFIWERQTQMFCTMEAWKKGKRDV